MSAESFEIGMLKPDVRTVLLPLNLTICTMVDPPDLSQPIDLRSTPRIPLIRRLTWLREH